MATPSPNHNTEWFIDQIRRYMLDTTSIVSTGVFGERIIAQKTPKFQGHFVFGPDELKTETITAFTGSGTTNVNIFEA